MHVTVWSRVLGSLRLLYFLKHLVLYYRINHALVHKFPYPAAQLACEVGLEKGGKTAAIQGTRLVCNVVADTGCALSLLEPFCGMIAYLTGLRSVHCPNGSDKGRAPTATVCSLLSEARASRDVLHVVHHSCHACFVMPTQVVAPNHPK